MKKILLFISFIALSANAQTVALQSFATGFSSPVEIAHAPNDPRLFVVQQGGLIRIVNSNGSINSTPFINLSSLISTGSERGLLGLAFHPNYATNGYFFVNYTNTSGNTVIARYSVSSNPNVANTTGTILMTINQPASNHNGGTLRFGQDGYLYIGMGDGGGGGDTSGYAQNLSLTHTQVAANPSRIYLGKMLRIDVDTTAGSLNYGFPPTNPYVAEAGKQEIWAIGLRNPWKFSFNRTNGDLWLADVGQGSIEEINKVSSPLPTALNFGWRCFEGNTVYSTSIQPCPDYAATVPPVTQYGHSANRCSVTGGYFYTGSAYPNFAGKYFVADYCSGEIGYIDNTNNITWAYNSNTTFSITTFGEDMNGELYVVVNSAIYKIIDSSMSVSEFERNGFTIFPNPSKDRVFIKNTKDISLSKIEVYDISGKLLMTESNPENSFVVSDLAKGMYLVAIETQAGNRFNTKLVVN